jgi:alpha/beta superfamily hydrolase
MKKVIAGDAAPVGLASSFGFGSASSAFLVAMRRAMQHELSVLALIKGPERFIYVYDDASRERLIDAIRDQAADPAVSLSWFDAAVLTERARQQAPLPNEAGRRSPFRIG